MDFLWFSESMDEREGEGNNIEQLDTICFCWEETSVVAAALHRLRGIFQEIGIPESCGGVH